MNRKSLLVVTVFVEGGLFLTGLILMRVSHLEPWSRLDVSWNTTAYALLFVIPMLLMLFFVVRSGWTPLFRYRAEIDEKVLPIFANSKLPDLALIALFAGLGEEFFFRGWLQSLLTGKFEVWSGIAIASAIFGLAHSLSFTYAVYAFLTGLYLGAIYQITGNLYIVMLLHALYDFVALLYLISKGKNVSTKTVRGR